MGKHEALRILEERRVECSFIFSSRTGRKQLLRLY